MGPVPGAARQNIHQRTVPTRPAPVTCQKLGHIEVACLQKRSGSQPVRNITRCGIKMVNSISTVPQLQQQVQIQGQDFNFEVVTGAADNFCSQDFWMKLGKPSLQLPTCHYEVANSQPLYTLGIRGQYPAVRAQLFHAPK